MPEADSRSALRAEIMGRLDQILDPCSVGSGTPMGLAEMGLVEHVDISPDGDVEIQLRLTSPFCPMIGHMTTEAIERVGSLDGVRSVAVQGDAGLDWSPDMISPEAQERRRLRLGVAKLLATSATRAETS
jgi:metal-sulfur cluster biosynthetic enzyme